MLNSLSQVLLKIASPGVPDFYQGNEVWDFSLADPDNRRPVDLAAHSRLLSTLCAESKEGDTPALLDRLYRSPEDGALKLYVTSRALRFRREHPALLLRGRYHPLKVIGRRHKHVIAFSRILGGDRVIAAADWTRNGSDDFHHSLHGVLTHERRGYMEDFGSLADLAKALREGFVFDGMYSRYRRRRFGNSAHDRPGEQFVVCIQNHDQIANLCAGRRLSHLVPLGLQQIAAALVVTAPFLPLLFMGEEYGETAPFDYFTSFEDAALVRAVRHGRRKETEHFLQNGTFHDPQEPATFENCKLDWELQRSGTHAGLLRLYRDLIALRKRYANLSNCRKDAVRVRFDENARWLMMERRGSSPEAIAVVCNFAQEKQSVPLPSGGGKPLLWSWAPEYGQDSGQATTPGIGQSRVELPAQSVLVCALTKRLRSYRIRRS